MAITYAEHKRFLAVRDELLKRLRAAAKHRDTRPELDANGEPAWVAYERQVMHEEVNAYRRDAGLPEIDLAEVARVERQACGHVDYADKYALYCAELACGIGPRELKG